MKQKFYPGAPATSDKEMVNQLFADYCNCYSYAVQDYFAGLLTGLSASQRDEQDGAYLPRPGQTRGKSYSDLKGQNVRGMQRAVCEDGLLFAGKTYPKKVPDNQYVICCFLTPNEYHFIRQNQDGSWTSKNGRGDVTGTDYMGEPLTDPENFYHKDPACSFVGYFFVPKGGIRVGVRAYEEKLLKAYEKRLPKEPSKKKLYHLLGRSVQMTRESEDLKNQTYWMWKTKPYELQRMWQNYLRDLSMLALFLGKIGFSRRSLLKIARTRGKENLP